MIAFAARTARSIAEIRRRKNQVNTPRVVSEKKRTYPIFQALEMVKARARAKFDETVEVALVLNVDPRKQNQVVRGMIQLPRGTGKKVRTAAPWATNPGRAQKR